MKNRTLYVPADVSLRNEVWKGLSVKDAVVSLGVGAGTAGLAVMLGLVFGVPQLWCVLMVMIAAGLSVAVLSKFDTNLSIVDYLGISLKYAKEQKQYLYVYRRSK